MTHEDRLYYHSCGSHVQTKETDGEKEETEMSETMERQRKQLIFLTFQFQFQSKALCGLLFPILGCPKGCLSYP